jgi:hypothetical protein
MGLARRRLQDALAAVKPDGQLLRRVHVAAGSHSPPSIVSRIGRNVAESGGREGRHLLEGEYGDNIGISRVEGEVS